jgi:hypothetical protein
MGYDVCYKCTISNVSDVFIGMFQVFNMDVAKVDRYVAYVAMVVHVYCKHLSSNVSSIFSNICCKYVSS